MPAQMKLVCPSDGGDLEDKGTSAVCRKCGKKYVRTDGILRFVEEAADGGQAQVQNGFAFKWTRDAWGFAPEHRAVMRKFLFDRFQLNSDADLEKLFGGKKVLHAGVGNGQEEQHYLHLCQEFWGADISKSVEGARRNWDTHHPTLADRLNLVQADLMSMPFPDGSFDLVLSDGVLHHTPNTFAALKAITAKVAPGGQVMFYVYKKKAPIREFVDDFLREKISGMEPEAAWKALEPLTALARDLSRQKITINVEQDFDLLELPAGEHDLQRWMYWNFMKFYWNEAFSFDENNHINYDWYYPQYAWRHTPDEVRGWLDELHLTAEVFNPGDSGISVIARK